MLIFDGDYPMAHNALGLNRDLTLPLDELRAADANPSNIPFGCLPEMRRGGVVLRADEDRGAANAQG